MSIRSLYKFIRSPDKAFPADRSPRSSLSSTQESSALPFPFPPEESDAQSSSSSNGSFYPLSIDQIFPPAASSVANSSSFSESVSLSFIGSEQSEYQEGCEQKEKPTILTLKDGQTLDFAPQIFTFQELATATKNFSPDVFLRGFFSHFYKGRLKSTGQVVVVKKLLGDTIQVNTEFVVEIFILSLLQHPNIVKFIGHCADGGQRLLVYEYMELGSLREHLFDLPLNTKPLHWNTRMKIAVEIAKTVEYLHEKAQPPVIHRDLKSSSILLSEGYHPKLSNFGLAKLESNGNEMYYIGMVGTYGYSAPECATRQFTVKCDVYSFGVVFLELITGRKAIDNTKSPGEDNLVIWARPMFKDHRKFPKMVDPLLKGRYPMHGLGQALAVADMCLQEQADARPPMGYVARELAYIASETYGLQAC